MKIMLNPDQRNLLVLALQRSQPSYYTAIKIDQVGVEKTFYLEHLPPKTGFGHRLDAVSITRECE